MSALSVQPRSPTMVQVTSRPRQGDAGKHGAADNSQGVTMPLQRMWPTPKPISSLPPSCRRPRRPLRRGTMFGQRLSPAPHPPNGSSHTFPLSGSRGCVMSERWKPRVRYAIVIGLPLAQQEPVWPRPRLGSRKRGGGAATPYCYSWSLCVNNGNCCCFVILVYRG